MITSLITISTLFFCSTAISNGFSPVFAVMGETRKSRLPWISLAIFFACKLAIDLATGVIGFTVIQYPVWALCYYIAKRSAIFSATVFYLLSNTLCFFTMNGMLGSLEVYPATASGYIACMAAGLPFYLRSLLATVIFSFLLRRIITHAPSSVRSLFPQATLATAE